MKVIGDRVLVALPPNENQIVSAGGIVLVSDPDKFQTPTRGIVVALGEKSDAVSLDDVLAVFDGFPDHSDWMIEAFKDALSDLKPAPFDVEVGDCVLFPRFVGEEIEQDGIRYVILREHEIIGVIEPRASAA